jgi:hypothetical protein
MLDPSIITAGMRQPEQVDPMGVLGKVLTLRSAQQQQELGALQLQEQRQKIADQQKVNDAYAAAYTKNDAGVITLNRDALASSLAQHNLGQHIPAMLETLDKADKSTADALKARAQADTAMRDATGALANGVRIAGYTPDAFMVAISHMVQNKLISPDDARPYVQAVQQDPSHVKALVDQILAQSPKQTELGTAGRTADARVQSAQTGADRLTAELPKISAETLRTTQETTGTQPMTLKQQADLKRQANTLAEQQRHNRATEAAANPFAGYAGPSASAPISQANPPMASLPPSGAPPAPAPRPPTPGTSRPGGPSTVPAPASAAVPQGLTGDAYLQTLPPEIANEVKAYAEGRRPFPQGFALKSPYFQTLIRMVGQYDPSFDAVNYNGRNKARLDFTAGASAKQITALNTVVGHLGDLAGKSDALGNSSFQDYNAIKNWIKTKVGSSDVTNFNTVKKGVTDELTRVWRQAGGSEQDIKTWGESLNAAQSPEQLSGAFSTITGMIGARLDALENQKQQGLGKTGADIRIITPQSKAILDRLTGSSSKGAAPKVGEHRLINGQPATWQTINGQSGWVADKP